MTTKTWNGADAPFNTDADWSTGTRPAPGDIALINAGTVSATGILTTPLTIKLASSAGLSPTLALTDATIANGDHITVTGGGSDATLKASGIVVNRGGITLAGANPVINLAAGTTPSFDNEGGISVTGSGGIITGAAASFVNNGTLSFRGPASGTPQGDSVINGITGTGTIRLSGTTNLQLGGSVAAGQTVQFEGGTSNLGLTLFDNFKGSITGFSAGQLIEGLTNRWTSLSFTKTSTGGTLNFTGTGGTTSLNFFGNYNQLGDFAVRQDTGTGFLSNTAIGSNLAPAPARMTFVDTVNDVSGSEAMNAYTGPVSYLQYEYIWNSTDDVVLGATVNNVFLHGGAGQDALVAVGGSNVLDGGAGSNFLIGAKGTDGGTDTFFVDERGAGVTWSTLLNFHVGDSLNIFGFKGGVSTLPWTENDGTPGYTGATIHSEIGGAGTGVNGSVTFAGVSLADVQSKFTITTGNVGGVDYLSVTNHG